MDMRLLASAAAIA
jgi:hypothetical protein